MKVLVFRAYKLRGPLSLSWLPRQSVLPCGRSLCDTQNNYKGIDSHRENAIDFFRRKAVAFISRNTTNNFANHERDPIKLLKLCSENTCQNRTQKLLCLLMEAFICTHNHTEAYKLFQDPQFEPAFTGEKGSVICLILMLFVYEQGRYINVVTVYQHIEKEKQNREDDAVFKLADAIYMSTLLKANGIIPSVPPPDFTLSRFFLSLHYLALNSYQKAIEVIPKTKNVKQKPVYYNLLVQISIHKKDFKDLFRMLQEVAFFRIPLCSDTWRLLKNISGGGTRDLQLSRYLYWATHCNLQKTMTLKEVLEHQLKVEVINVYETKKDDWDTVGEYLQSSGRTRRNSSSSSKKK